MKLLLNTAQCPGWCGWYSLHVAKPVSFNMKKRQKPSS